MTQTKKKFLLQATHGGKSFRIAFGGAGIGYYLYVYDGERCTHDYLQDSVDDVQAFALETFGVSRKSWTDAHELV